MCDTNCGKEQFLLQLQKAKALLRNTKALEVAPFMKVQNLQYAPLEDKNFAPSRL